MRPGKHNTRKLNNKTVPKKHLRMIKKSRLLQYDPYNYALYLGYSGLLLYISAAHSGSSRFITHFGQRATPQSWLSHYWPNATGVFRACKASQRQPTIHLIK